MFVARYSFIQLSELWQRGVNEVAKVLKRQQSIRICILSIESPAFKPLHHRASLSSAASNSIIDTSSWQDKQKETNTQNRQAYYDGVLHIRFETYFFTHTYQMFRYLPRACYEVCHNMETNGTVESSPNCLDRLAVPSSRLRLGRKDRSVPVPGWLAPSQRTERTTPSAVTRERLMET